MAYDEALAARVVKLVEKHPRRRAMTAKEMFGGWALMVDGKMFVGVLKDDLLARVGPDAHDAAVARPHARVFDFTGRPMRGYVYVAPAGVKTAAALRAWVEQSLAFAETLPAKRPKPAPRKAPKGR